MANSCFAPEPHPVEYWACDDEPEQDIEPDYSLMVEEKQSDTDQ